MSSPVTSHVIDNYSPEWEPLEQVVDERDDPVMMMLRWSGYIGIGAIATFGR